MNFRNTSDSFNIWRKNSLEWRQIENAKNVLLCVDINAAHFSQILNQAKLLLAEMIYFVGLLPLISIISFLILIEPAASQESGNIEYFARVNQYRDDDGVTFLGGKTDDQPPTNAQKLVDMEPTKWKQVDMNSQTDRKELSNDLKNSPIATCVNGCDEEDD